MVPAAVHGLFGVLHVRFSPLWPAACQALAACLQYQYKVRREGGRSGFEAMGKRKLVRSGVQGTGLME
jgi:hypothetical protein